MPYGPKVYKDNNGDRLNIATGGTFDAVLGTRKSNGIALSEQKWVDVTCTATLLDASTGTGKVTVMAAGTGVNATDQYKIRNIRLVGGGTNFGSGGDRLLSLTDGTTV